ncbi:RISC-loading complex subunit tarbp2-like isoform X3 [Pollicipes pollicipes]|uniref:RISC-loading complex subunit tarbp2-like isoform X3 n=1 Tax=Pollicipes pollicipes TaxID=41117 RepID=UPI0018854AB0|nr:RISC-loading complex subunit tarbp2-like isoform X3 [Pollicipes pollicipes]
MDADSNSNGVAVNGTAMPTMPSKTPVSLLQELCAKRGITPKYELIQVEGAVHEPTFLYRATVGEFIASGQGQSKKKAKHAVAKAVLDMVLGNQAAPPGAPAPAAQAESPLEQLVSPYDDGIPGNPVGQLQELCMAYRYPPPAYELSAEEGLPHERTFTIACRIGTAFTETGVGKSKKIAKRQASNLMLSKLREAPPLAAAPADAAADPAASEAHDPQDTGLVSLACLSPEDSSPADPGDAPAPQPAQCSGGTEAGGPLLGPDVESDPAADGVQQRARGTVPPQPEGGRRTEALRAAGDGAEPIDVELRPVPAGAGLGADVPNHLG